MDFLNFAEIAELQDAAREALTRCPELAGTENPWTWADALDLDGLTAATRAVLREQGFPWFSEAMAGFWAEVWDASPDCEAMTGVW